MPKISQQKKDKISEQILHHLYSVSPNAIHTNAISREIARDEEFTKALLLDLKSKNLIVEVKKSPLGSDYLRRQRWRLSNQVYNIYSKKQL